MRTAENEKVAKNVDIEKVKALHARLLNNIETLRYEERTPKMDREAILRWLNDQIEAMKDMVDLPGGWRDPNDPYAEMSLEILRLEFMEMSRPGNPYPIPRDDPRERTGSGHLVRRDVTVPRVEEVRRMVDWSPESALWKQFVKGERPGRFWLRDGSSIYVVPRMATPPKGVTEWVRPGEFWAMVPPAEGYGWAEVSPFMLEAQAPVKAEAPVKPDAPQGSELQRFLTTLFGNYEKGWIELRALPSGKKEYFPLIETLADPKAVEAMVAMWTRCRENVFVGVLPRGVHGKSRKADIYQAGVAWAELDFEKQDGGREGVMEKVASAGADMAVLSGGGCHVYWKLSKVVDLTIETTRTFEGFLKRKQQGLKADPVHDITRLLRVPGSLNYKYDPARKVELLCQ